MTSHDDIVLIEALDDASSRLVAAESALNRVMQLQDPPSINQILVQVQNTRRAVERLRPNAVLAR